MTQAPTPGPLDSESVKLLVKGDLISHPEHGVAQYWPVLVDDMYLTGPWSFIGRPGADGWMTWSGGEPTITDPTVDIEVRLRNGELHVDRSPAFDWTYDPEPHPFDIIAFRLAPTAPVEASGSEREHWSVLSDLHTIKGWLHGLSTAPDLTDVVADGGVSVGDCYQQEAREFAGRLGRVIEALRPQPSGETREVGLDVFGDEVTDVQSRYIIVHQLRASADIQDTETKRKTGWATTSDRASLMRKAADTIERLALLSARPLAFGGQK